MEKSPKITNLTTSEEELMPLHDELRSSPLFSDLYDEEIRRVISRCIFSEHKEDSAVSNPDDPEALYFILKGKACLEVSGEGKPLEYRRLQAGGVVFEKLFESDFGRRLNVTARSDVQAMTLPTDRLFALYRLDPKIYGIFITNLLSQMFRDSAIANGLIARIFFSNSIKIGLPIYPASRRKIWDQKMRESLERGKDEESLKDASGF